MSQVELLRLVALFGLIGFLLYRNLPAALLFLNPGWIRLWTEGGPDSVGPQGHGAAIADMLAQVTALGFQPLGVKWEQKPLTRRAQKEFVFGSDEEKSFAGIMPVTNEAWLYFYTPFRGGAAVITADFKWPAAEDKDYLAGGLPAATATELLNAHRRRVQRFVDAGQTPVEPSSLRERIEVTRSFYRTGPGRRETRRRELKGLMFTAGALFLLATLVKSVLERYGSGPT